MQASYTQDSPMQTKISNIVIKHDFEFGDTTYGETI